MSRQNNDKVNVGRPYSIFKRSTYSPLIDMPSTSMAPTQENVSILNFPEELFSELCKYLPASDISSLQKTCKQFDGFIKADLFWNIMVRSHYANINLDDFFKEVGTLYEKKSFLAYEEKTAKINKSLTKFNANCFQVADSPPWFFRVYNTCNIDNTLSILISSSLVAACSFICLLPTILGITIGMALITKDEKASLITMLGCSASFLSVFICHLMVASGCTLSNHLTNKIIERNKKYVADNKPEDIENFRPLSQSKELTLLFKDHQKKEKLTSKEVYQKLHSAKRIHVIEV